MKHNYIFILLLLFYFKTDDTNVPILMSIKKYPQNQSTQTDMTKVQSRSNLTNNIGQNPIIESLDIKAFVDRC